MMSNSNLFALPHELLILGAAVDTGILEPMREGAVTLKQCAAEAKADERALWVIFEALAALGYLVREKDTYSLTKEARDMFFNQESSAYIGYSFMDFRTV